MSRYLKKWGLVLRVLLVVMVLVAIKYFVDSFNFSIISASALVGAFVGGVIFTLGVIFGGTLSDYKESERIPGELAAAIKTLYKDTRTLPSDEAGIVLGMQDHIRELIAAINGNFTDNRWKQREINLMIDRIDDDICRLSQKGTPPPFIGKMRTELTNIEKLSNRIETIMETSFIPAAYSIAELGVGMVILMLMLMKVDPWHEGLALLGIISLMLLSILALIKDMDNPFEVGRKSYADVDLSHLRKLEKYLNER